MKNLSVFFGLALLLIPCLCQGQFSSADLTAIESTTLLTADQMPLTGTFYSAANPQTAPVPANFFGASGWAITGGTSGTYLLDDLDGSSGGGFHAMDDSGPGSPGSDGSGYVFTSSYTFSIPTNGLWLWITNAANGTVYANLNGATDYVYEIFSTTNLLAVPAVTNWNIETEVFPGVNTNTTSFSVPVAGRNPLFLWARDWTYITSNGNTTPDWWFYEYFGAINLLDTNLDPQGNTLLYDYQNHDDPNIVTFSLQFTNNFWNGSASGAVSIQGGEPFYEAIMVDDTNYMSDAVWQPYTSSNLTVNLGTTQGWHSVWIGLRGRATSETQTWKWKHLKLDSLAPVLVVTNPVVSTVSVPVIQVYGYSPEALDTISCTVSNAVGTAISVNTEIRGDYFDTNIWDITTNYFACLDIPLTNGPNVVTIQATDMAGNVTVTNIGYTLDYSGATNPSVTLTWPQNNMQLCQGIFTVRGWTEDSSAQVMAQIVDTNGDTNVVSGIVERSGVFWVENLPLAEGTNELTLWITNSAGLSSMTNISLVKSDLTLMLTNVADDLWLPAVHVSGFVSDPTAAVSVNGVAAVNNGDGTWNASDVPVSPSGVGSFDMSATSTGGHNSQAGTNEDKQTEIIMTESLTKVKSTPLVPDNSGNWITYLDNFFYAFGSPISGDYNSDNRNGDYFHTHVSYPACPGDCGEGTAVNILDISGTITTNISDIDYDGGYLFSHSDVESINEGDDNVQKGQSEYFFQVGGKSTDKDVAEVTIVIVALQPDFLNIDPEWTVLSSNIKAGDFGPLDDSYNAYKQVSGGEMVKVTPIVSGVDYYTITAMTPALYQPTHTTRCVAFGNPDNTRTTIGIGEAVDFRGMPGGTTWIDSNGFTTTTNSGDGTTLVASMSPVNATATATIDKVNIPWTFTVIAPSSVVIFTNQDNPSIVGDANAAGTKMGADTVFTDIVGPTAVSFANANLREFLTNNGNITVFWPDTNRVEHFKFNTAFSLDCGDSFLQDEIEPPLALTNWIFNGTSYVNFSYSVTWHYQYLNASGSWTDFYPLNVSFAYQSGNKQCTITYLGKSGGPQGPFQ